MAFNKTELLQLGESPAMKRLAWIELNILLVAFAAILLILSGPCRRRCSNGAMKLIQWICYTLITTHLFTSTIGEMQSAPFRNQLFALWGAFMLIVFGNTDSFSAYSLEDNENWKRYRAMIMYQGILVGLMIGFYLGGTKYKWHALAMSLFVTYKADEKTSALKNACKSSLAKSTKLISDFMASEHQIPVNGEPNPVTMKGYQYLVSGESEEEEGMAKISKPLYKKKLDVARDEIVTLEKVWGCQGSLLKGETGEKLKDICLSFAFFKLLCRRFGGNPFLESNKEKTWGLIRDGLLDKEGDCERAFRVIEVELCFLFDLFYTKYAVIFKGGQGFAIISKLFNTAVLFLGGFLAINMMIKYKPSVDEFNLVTTGGVDVDKFVTSILMVLIFVMEILQYFFLVVSDWATVLWICSYVRGKSWPRSGRGHNLCNVVRTKMVMLCHKWFKPWDRKLGQYFLLMSFKRDPVIYKLSCLLECVVSDVIEIPKQGRKGNFQIELPTIVKKAVADALRRNGRRLSNGEESLRRNGVWRELFGARKLKTPTHVVLVWHVATTLCVVGTRPKSFSDEDFVVATSLSGYCAYLVAFAPRLISDNPNDAEFIFDEVLKDARDSLKECDSEIDMYGEIMSRIGEGEETIIHLGARLASDLQKMQDDRDFMWKVLAEFWAELMLFLASIGDPIAHVEHLAEGGEFVTHLWALLSHAGIINQVLTSQDV